MDAAVATLRRQLEHALETKDRLLEEKTAQVRYRAYGTKARLRPYKITQHSFR
jgi:hypothetical protein